MNINQVLKESQKLDYDIRNLFRISTFNEYNDLSGLDIDYEDAQQLFLLDEVRMIMEKLDDVRARLSYLNLPIKEISKLHKNEIGKYETESGHYYCCGSNIEALVMDDCHGVPYWVCTRVEHDGEGYYLVGNKAISLNGLTVRVRG